MNFQCPSCNITLQGEPDFAGKTVKCPSCGSRIQIPADFGAAPAPDAAAGADADQESTHHELHPDLPELNLGTKQGAHPATVSIWVALGLGVGVTLLVYLIMFLIPSTVNAEGIATGPWIKQFFINRGWPQYASTFLTGWLESHIFGTDKKLEDFILKSDAK